MQKTVKGDKWRLSDSQTTRTYCCGVMQTSSLIQFTKPNSSHLRTCTSTLIILRNMQSLDIKVFKIQQSSTCSTVQLTTKSDNRNSSTPANYFCGSYFGRSKSSPQHPDSVIECVCCWDSNPTRLILALKFLDPTQPNPTQLMDWPNP